MHKAPSFDQMLRELVATPSISSTHAHLDSGNRAVCECLAGWLEPLGFRCELLPLPGQQDKCNLIAVRGHGDGGLVLAGHADTVPFDAAGWTTDPFALRAEDSAWYGLGSCDMKGFLGLCVGLAAELVDQPLHQPLTILATADEESGMNGAKALARSGRKLGRFAVVGEPTGLRPVRMHKGIFMDGLTIRGRAGHSSDPANGVNAVEGLHQALGEILRFGQELRQRGQRAEFSVPHATLNPGCIHGGDTPNRIPAECELQFDLRMLPGQELETLRTELRARIDDCLAHGPWQWQHHSLFDGAESFETPADAAIIQAAERLTETPAQAVNFATEGGYFNQMGMQTVILGPGDIAQAHQPNEYLPRSHIAPMQTILRGLVKEFCLDG